MLSRQDLSRVNSTILLTGETGTGKSSLVKELHQQKKGTQPLVEVNLAAISENLLESELFGHKKGAFTGAVDDKKGYLDQVGSGILFLDEIGELTLAAQKKLLLLLENKYYFPVGSTVKKEFRGQLIVATHQDLALMVSRGEFRADLYYRLKVFPFHLLPLREQSSELLQIAYKLLSQHFERPRMRLTSEVEDLFLKYDWPGNVRELKHVLEYALLFTDHEISLKHLPPWLKPNIKISYPRLAIKSYTESLEAFEREFFTQAMEFYQGRINQSAVELKLSKVTLISKLKKYQINSLSYRAKKREIELAS